LYKIKEKALKRGYNFKVFKLLLNVYITDERKLGRPLILTLNIVKMIEDIVTRNSMTRSWSCNNIAVEVTTRLGIKKAICAKSVYKVLKAKKYKSCKQMTKLGLIKEMKAAR
jgi:hypothetical protein